MPLAAFAVVFIAGAVKQPEKSASHAQAVVVVSGVVLLALGSIAWSRTHVFENSVSMWRDTAAKNPQSGLAESALAEQLRLKAAEDVTQSDPDTAKAELNEALLHAQTALQIDPSSAQAELTWADALVTQGQVAQALPHFNQATLISVDDPHIRTAYASALISLGRFEPAIAQLNQALRIDAASALAHEMLGEAYEGLHNSDRAIAEENTALQLDYNDTVARQKLAEMQAKTGKYKDAIENYAIILSDKTQLQRADLWLALGKIKIQQGQPGPAVDYLMQAAQLDATSTEISKLLADETEKLRKMSATTQSVAATQPKKM